MRLARLKPGGTDAGPETPTTRAVPGTNGWGTSEEFASMMVTWLAMRKLRSPGVDDWVSWTLPTPRKWTAEASVTMIRAGALGVMVLLRNTVGRSAECCCSIRIGTPASFTGDRSPKVGKA